MLSYWRLISELSRETDWSTTKTGDIRVFFAAMSIVIRGILKSNTGFYSQGGHIRSAQALLKLRRWKHEVYLVGLKFVVQLQRRNVVIVIQTVKIVDKSTMKKMKRKGRRRHRLFGLKDLGDNYWDRIFTEERGRLGLETIEGINCTRSLRVLVSFFFLMLP